MQDVLATEFLIQGEHNWQNSIKATATIVITLISHVQISSLSE